MLTTTCLPRCLVLSSLLLAGTALAQLPTAPTLNAPSAAEKSADAKTIALADLPRRLSEEAAFIERVVAHSTAQADTPAFADELAQLGEDVDTLGRHLIGQDFDALPLSGLESLERHLVFLDRALAQLQDALQAATRPLSEGAGEIAQRRKVWRDTRQASEELIPPTLLANVEALDADFARAADDVARPLARLLALGHTANALRTRVGDHLQSVRDQIALSSRQLWTLDSPSLLRVIADANTQSDGSLRALLASIAIQGEFVKEYDRAYRPVHFVLAVLAALTLPLVLYLSRWAGQVIDRRSGLERYRATLARPLSLWLLLVVACWLVVDADGPYLYQVMLLALAWLPAMRLQPPWINQAIGGWKYATSAYFLLGFLSLLISPHPIVFRPLLLFNGLLLLAALLWLFTHPPRADADAHPWRARVARWLVGFWLLPTCAAIVANVIGSVGLAVLLTEATIRSLYLAFFLLAVRELVGAYVFILRASGAVRRRAEHASRLLEVVFNLFNLGLIAAWLVGTLAVFRVLRQLKVRLAALSQFAVEFGSVTITLGGVVTFCVSVLLSFWIARTLRAILADDVLPGMTLPRGVANSVSTMSYYALLLLGLLTAVSMAGFELSQLALVLGALSVGIGFGLNTVINHFVCGLILMIERPIQPGDCVEFAGTTGKIRDIGIRTTTLATFDGADVMIPNGLLLADKLTNWTFYNDRRRIEVPIGVAYGSALRAVQSLLLGVARRVPGISRDPEPVALFMGFGESSLDFCVRAWIDDFDQSASVRSELAIEMHDALQGAGIGIPFPQRDVHIRSFDTGIATADETHQQGAHSSAHAPLKGA